MKTAAAIGSLRLILGLSLIALALFSVVPAFVGNDAEAHEDHDTRRVEGQILVQLLGERDAIVGFRSAGGETIVPDSRPLPVGCALDFWVATNLVLHEGVPVGQVLVRRLEGGWIEVGFRPIEGEDILPRARFIPPNAGTYWHASSSITLSVKRLKPLPDFHGVKKFDAAVAFVGQEMSPITLPESNMPGEDITYGLTPEVPGLTFDPLTRTLSGTPTVTGLYDLIYRAKGSSGHVHELRYIVFVGEDGAHVNQMLWDLADREPSLFEDDTMSDDYYDDNGMEADDSMMGEDDEMMAEDDSMMDESEDAFDEESADEPSSTPTDTTFADNPRTGFTLTREYDTSTFSLDVDLTSYQLAQNWAANNYLVEPDSARAEEWINSFDYGYAPPEPDDEFAISTAVLDHPLDDDLHIARIGFQAPTLPDDKPLNIALVLDASGSMAWGNRVEIARAAAETIHAGLRCIDRVAVVHFTTTVLHQYTVEGAAPGSPEVYSSIERLSPHHSTNVQRGLDLGVQLVAEMRKHRPDAYNYVILMSDGVANVDATDPFKILDQIGDQNVDNPIRLITIGVGIQNYNDFLLEQLSQHGNGWYRYLDTPEQAREVFARENWVQLSTPFADQARTQVVWDETQVAQWRLIGYENRVTSAESFTEDRTEFAEVPSGVAVTALYELVLTEAARDSLDTNTESLGTVSLRWITPNTGESKLVQQDIQAGPGPSEDPNRAALDELAAIVGLTADRYGAIDSAHELRGEQGQIAGIELRALQEALRQLQEQLPANAEHEDFARLLDHLIRSVPEPEPSDN